MRKWTVAIVMGASLSAGAHVDIDSELSARASIVRQPAKHPFVFESSRFESNPNRDEMPPRSVIYFDAPPTSSSLRIRR